MTEQGLASRLDALRVRKYRFGRYCGICGDDVSDYWDLRDDEFRGVIYVCQDCRIMYYDLI